MRVFCITFNKRLSVTVLLMSSLIWCRSFFFKKLNKKCIKTKECLALYQNPFFGIWKKMSQKIHITTLENNRPYDIRFYWESFSDFHTNKRSTQFSWWRQRGPPTSLLNRFLPTLSSTMCNFPFIFWWWSGMNQEWKFFWHYFPSGVSYSLSTSISLLIILLFHWDLLLWRNSTYLPQNSSACLVAQ